MATVSKRELSGGADGVGVKIGATSTPGTTIHTSNSGNAGADDYDEVWLWAYNSHTAAVELTIEWGGVTAPDNNIKVTLPSKTGLVLIIPGLVLENSKTVAAFAGTTNVIVIYGFVNRMTP